MGYDLLVLGAASATPTSQQYTTCQLLTMREQLFLLDCGEGAQQQLRRHKVKTSRIHHIFITHLHGDHYFGLVGLISSYHLQRRSKPLHIYGPAALEHVIQTILKASKTRLSYPLEFHPTNPDNPEVILDDEKVTVRTVPLIHGIATTAFVFCEKEKMRKLNMEAIKQYQVDIADRRNLQLGKDFIAADGRVIPNSQLTHKPERPLSYAFCTDTAYNPKLVQEIVHVDLLYHETTFTEKEKELARETRHSTAKDAATVAKMAEVRTLLMGHYSARYADQSVHLAEAREYFENVIAGTDNLHVHVDHTSINAVQK